MVNKHNDANPETSRFLDESCIDYITGAHPGGLFSCHDRPLCTAGRLLSIKADD